MKGPNTSSSKTILLSTLLAGGALVSGASEAEAQSAACDKGAFMETAKEYMDPAGVRAYANLDAAAICARRKELLFTTLINLDLNHCESADVPELKLPAQYASCGEGGTEPEPADGAGPGGPGPAPAPAPEAAPFPMPTFDFEGLPPGATIDLIDRLGDAIPKQIDRLPLKAALKNAMQGFPRFALAGVDPLTDISTQRDKMWAKYYEWLRQKGFTPNVLPAADVTPETEWECPAGAECAQYLENALAAIKPVVERVKSTNPNDAKNAEGQLRVAEDAAQPLHRRIIATAAAWQYLPDQYRAFYEATTEDGAEALTEFTPEMVPRLIGRQVTMYQWINTGGSMRVQGPLDCTVTNDTTADELVVNVNGRDYPQPAETLNGKAAVASAAGAAGTPAVSPSVRVLVKWHKAWKEANDGAMRQHGRTRIPNPLDPDTGLPIYIGHEIEMVQADGTITVGVLEEVNGNTVALDGSSYPFSPNATVFFAGVQVGDEDEDKGDRNKRKKGDLSLGVSSLNFVSAAGSGTNETMAYGLGGAADLNFAAHPNIDVEAALGYMGHDTNSRNPLPDRRGDANPSGVVALGAVKPHVNNTFLGGADFGLSAGGGLMAGGGAMTGGAYLQWHPSKTNQIELDLGFAHLFDATARPESRLGRPMPRSIDADVLTLALTWRYRVGQL